MCLCWGSYWSCLVCINVFDRQRITYEPKWTIALIDLSLDDKIAIEGGKLSFIITFNSLYYCCMVLLLIFRFAVCKCRLNLSHSFCVIYSMCTLGDKVAVTCIFGILFPVWKASDKCSCVAQFWCLLLVTGCKLVNKLVYKNPKSKKWIRGAVVVGLLGHQRVLIGNKVF